jgi:ATP-binding cassette subfamily F protein uup
VETLELLEELLSEYSGTLLLVSHDRSFIDQTVTSTLWVDGTGRVVEHIGGYSDWHDYYGRSSNAARALQPASEKTKSRSASRNNRLSYKEKRELENLPEKIEQLENSQAQLQALSAQADFYKKPKEEITRTLAELEALDAQLLAAYARWEEIESKQDDG